MDSLCKKMDSDRTMEELLKNIKCFVLDLDGTFYLGNKILDGSLEFLNTLEKNNINFKFFTNNSSRNRKYYIEKIEKMGYKLKEDMMLISNQVIIHNLKEKMPNKKIFILGNEYLKNDFIEAGIEVVEEDPDIVVVGFDTSLVYENVSKACHYIRNGAIFYGVNPDFNCPTEDGFIPDCGAICKMITASTGVEPQFFGKPSYYTLDYIIENTGYKEEEIGYVGDRLYTDIALGKENNIVTILVLSGETNIQDLYKSDIQPKLIFDSLRGLKEQLEEIN